jgi:hypothetical protein
MNFLIVFGRVSSAAGSSPGARQRPDQNRATPDLGQPNLCYLAIEPSVDRTIENTHAFQSQNRPIAKSLDL